MPLVGFFSEAKLSRSIQSKLASLVTNVGEKKLCLLQIFKISEPKPVLEFFEDTVKVSIPLKDESLSGIRLTINHEEVDSRFEILIKLL